MKRIRQVINFIALCLFFDWMYGQERPKEWLSGELWFWQKPTKTIDESLVALDGK